MTDNSYTRCPKCGATHYQEPETRLDAIPDNEHIERALEVGLVAFHSIAITGWQPELFANWYAREGGVAFIADPCPCGNYGSPRYECTCTVSQNRAWRKKSAYRKALAADIWVQSVEPRADQVTDARRKEPDETILDRISLARTRPIYPERLEDDSSKNLLQAYLRQVGHPERVPAIMRVASSVARLASIYNETPVIHAAHLAEAMQYTPRQEDL